MARITHPRPRPGRVTDLGIEFVDGIADVDLTDRDVLRQALTQHRYGIDEVPELEEHTVPELKKLAAEKGVDLPAKAKKADIVDAIADAPPAPED